MAILTIRDREHVLTEPGAIEDFLARHGIWYRRVEGQGPLAPDASQGEILAAYDEPVQKLMVEGRYTTADVIRITPETAGLAELLAKFDREHVHEEDEVRFIVDGRGLFHINPDVGPVFSIEVEAGDMISVPRGTKHWFHVCDERRCRAVRLFEDPSGWTPHYTASRIEEQYPPRWRGSEWS